MNEKDVNQVSIDYNTSENYRAGNDKHVSQKKSSKSNKSAYKSVPKSKPNDYNIKQTASSALKSPEESKLKPKLKTKQKDDQKAAATKAEHVRIVELINDSFKNNDNKPPQTSSEFYRVGKVLGKGAFGKVSLALHKLSKKLVALKLLNKEILRNETSKEKVMQEVRILKRFRHPNVVKLYETFESEKHIVLVMELCAGGDLLNYVRKRRRLKEEYAKYIFKQIMEGIAHVHQKGVLHRDIKLDNILLDGKGVIKIGDFGVSRIITNINDKMTEQCGTPAYIAPEILRDKGYYGFGCDIWSAGVVLYAMLYGTVPFKANNMNDLHKLIMKGKYTLKDDISEESRDLLKN